ncbi:MAG: PKD domain-containing protein [Lutisporaceae bacterium]
MISNKYKVVDTLYQSELQNIYVAEYVENINPDKFIINEILDGSIIYAIKDVFNDDLRLVVKNFIEYLYQDSNFFIVSKVTPGSTLDNHLSSTNLRISDKMYITENLLSQLLKLKTSSHLLEYHLLSLKNLYITGSRTINFNLGIQFDKDALDTTTKNIISKLGDVICCIFANTTDASLDKDKDNLPPAIVNIVRKCMVESYNSIEEVYQDFKSSLLYSTFIDSGSIDKLIIKNIEKAKRKRSLKSLKRFAAVVLILAVITGCYFAKDDLLKYIPVIRGNKQSTDKQNQIPIAKYTLSKNKVYAGDKIDFVCEASDPDIDDNITSYEWSVSRNNDMYILFSREQNPSYTFDAEGDYIVSLIVKDTTGISSNAYKVEFKVLPKEVIPDTPGDKDPNDILK